MEENIHHGFNQENINFGNDDNDDTKEESESTVSFCFIFRVSFRFEFGCGGEPES